MSRPEWLSVVWQDLRYAARGLRARPGFTTAVVVTLALGIGANAAMFSIVDRLLFRPPPMLASPALTHRVYLASTYRGKENVAGSAQYARYVDLTRDTRSFARTAEVTERKLAIGTGTDAREMQVGVVSASFFGFFDAPPALGRYFTADEDKVPQGASVAVLSWGMWQTQYGGRTDVLGQQLHIGPTVYTVIGVAPKGFVGLWSDQPPVAFIPITTYAATMGFSIKGETWYGTYHWTWASMIAQRKPGVSVEAATADLTDAYRRSYRAELEANPHDGPPIELRKPHGFLGSILRERGPNQSSVAKVASLVGAMAVLVLLIACANVANLLLSRALRRRREIAVRLALGVSRGRLLSQLLTESLLLSVLGGFAGIFVGQWGARALRAVFVPDGVDQSVAGDPRTILFAGLAVVLAGLLTGLAPVWQARRTDLTRDLKTGTREGQLHHSGARVALLVVQGALSVVLLVGAGLFVRSVQHVRALRMGYDVDPILIVDFNMRGVELDSVRAVALRRDVAEAARSVPAVAEVAQGVTLPFWSMWSTGLHVAGIDSVDKLGQFDLNAVTPEYFATMGTRIVRGRGIQSSDVEHAPLVMVVSEGMAKTLWPGKDALGQCVKVNADTMPCTTVVGVAENIRDNTIAPSDSGLFYYLSLPQWHPQQAMLYVRMRGDAGAQVETLRRKLQGLMPGASYVTVTPFSDIVGSETRSWRLGATVFVAFGVLALTLATIGLYSVIAYNVLQRTHEMGVRIALGAQFRDVVRLIVGQGLRLGLVGIVLGGAIAYGAAKWVKPLLFEESPRDPVVFALTLGVMIVVAAAASFIPARRAARVEPSIALRSE